MKIVVDMFIRISFMTITGDVTHFSTNTDFIRIISISR